MKLFYRTMGEGFPLIILHGLLGMSDNWVAFAKKMIPYFKVIIPDLRNHGNSPHASIMNLQAMADDVIELADDLQLDSFHLLGHSLGGKVAMTILANESDRVQKIIIEDIAPKAYPKEHLAFLQEIKKIQLINFNSRKEIESYLQTFISQNELIQLLQKNIRSESNGKYNWKPNVDILSESAQDILAEVIFKGKLFNKCMFIKGEKSNYINENDVFVIKEYLPNARFITIPNAGHWVHVDNPKAFFHRVINFLH